MGEAGSQPPPLPNFEWATVPETHRKISKNRQECNWLQALEGGIDTAHAPILHRTITVDTNKPGIGVNTDFVTGGAPTLEVMLPTTATVTWAFATWANGAISSGPTSTLCPSTRPVPVSRGTRAEPPSK